MSADSLTSQSELRSVTQRLARERYAPKAAAWDLDRTPFPRDERRYLGSLGLARRA